MIRLSNLYGFLLGLALAAVSGLATDLHNGGARAQSQTSERAITLLIEGPSDKPDIDPYIDLSLQRVDLSPTPEGILIGGKTYEITPATYELRYGSATFRKASDRFSIQWTDQQNADPFLVSFFIIHRPDKVVDAATLASTNATVRHRVDTDGEKILERAKFLKFSDVSFRIGPAPLLRGIAYEKAGISYGVVPVCLPALGCPQDLLEHSRLSAPKPDRNVLESLARAHTAIRAPDGALAQTDGVSQFPTPKVIGSAMYLDSEEPLRAAIGNTCEAARDASASAKPETLVDVRTVAGEAKACLAIRRARDHAECILVRQPSASFPDGLFVVPQFLKNGPSLGTCPKPEYQVSISGDISSIEELMKYSVSNRELAITFGAGVYRGKLMTNATGAPVWQMDRAGAEPNGEGKPVVKGHQVTAMIDGGMLRLDVRKSQFDLKDAQFDFVDDRDRPVQDCVARLLVPEAVQLGDWAGSELPLYYAGDTKTFGTDESWPIEDNNSDAQFTLSFKQPTGVKTKCFVSPLNLTVEDLKQIPYKLEVARAQPPVTIVATSGPNLRNLDLNQSRLTQVLSETLNGVLNGIPAAASDDQAFDFKDISAVVAHGAGDVDFPNVFDVVQRGNSAKLAQLIADNAFTARPPVSLNTKSAATNGRLKDQLRTKRRDQGLGVLIGSTIMDDGEFCSDFETTSGNIDRGRPFGMNKVIYIVYSRDLLALDRNQSKFDHILGTKSDALYNCVGAAGNPAILALVIDLAQIISPQIRRGMQEDISEQISAFLRIQ